MAKGKGEQHMPPNITTVKVKNDHLQISYIDRVMGEKGEEVVNNLVAKLRHEPHPDLKDKLDKLVPHLGMLEDGVDAKGFEDISDPKLQDIHRRYAIRHIQILEHEGVTNGVRLGGYRRLNRGGSPLNMLVPKVMFQAEGEKYEYADHLEELIGELIDEVRAYLGGKRAAPGQVTMGFATAEGEGDGDGDGEGSGDGDE